MRQKKMSSSSSSSSSSLSSSSSESDDSGSPRYMVESVVAHRINVISGKDEYRILWQNSKDSTWEQKEKLIEDGLEEELKDFDEQAESEQPLLNDKRAQLLERLLGRRSIATKDQTMDTQVASGNPDNNLLNPDNNFPNPDKSLATPAHEQCQQKTTPMTSVQPHPAQPAQPTQPTQPTPLSQMQYDYCTPRMESPPTAQLPTFEEEEPSSSSSSSSSSPDRRLLKASPSRPSPGVRRQKKSPNIPTPGKVIKNQLFATSENVRIFAAARRPRAMSSEGIFSGHGGGNPPRDPTTSFSSSSSSFSSVLSPSRQDFLFRRPNAVRSPGGHLLTSITPQPSSVRMRGAVSVGFKRRRQQQQPKLRGVQKVSGHSITRRMGDGGNDRKFVRVITPMRKRQKRSQDLTESQRDRKNELKIESGLLD